MIIVGTIGQSDLIAKAGVDLSPIKNKKEAFLLTVSSTGKLVIAGSDKRGTAYGVIGTFTVDRRFSMGVVGRCDPCKERDFSTTGFLSEYAVSFCRISGGFFINDEDWGLTPWSWQTYEPSNMKGQIGPKTHERYL